MPVHRTSLAIAAALAAIVVRLATPAAAESVADFYKGKTIAIVMGTGPGGSYDLYGRTIAEHIARHIPGNPEHHRRAHAGRRRRHRRQPHLRHRRRRTAPSCCCRTPSRCRRSSSRPGVRFESAKFHWLGAYDAIVQALTLWHTAPANNVDELKTADIVVGSFSKTPPDLSMGLAAQGRHRRQVQDRHRLSQRQRLQPRHGARRDQRLDRVVGEHHRHAAAVAGRRRR